MSLKPVLAAAMVLVGGVAQAEEPGSPTGTVEAEPTHFQVIGLSPNDELNIRATASATGMLIARLPIGALVRNLGCSDVGSYRWCKVGDLNDEKVQGWAAARYLEPADAEMTDGDLAPPADEGDMPEEDFSEP